MIFNLLDEHWIPVLYRDGRWSRVGIRDAFRDAHRIRQVAASNPMDRVAILRFLLAVLYWCKPEPTPLELEPLRSDGAKGIDSEWLKERLGTPEQPNGAFDLLGDQGGFYQDHAAGGVKVAVTNLLHDFPSGSNIAHFRHTRDKRDGMCLPCCALGLLRWSTAAPAGTAGPRQSMTASINGVAPTYSIPTGKTLLATLRLSWPSSIVIKGDVPVWDGANEGSPLGFLKGTTWRSRRILLAPLDEDGNRELAPGCCCRCGEQTVHLVRTIFFRPGWRRPSKEPWREDPHLLRITRKDGQSGKAKEKKFVPSWPSPNDPLEDCAVVWRSVLEGLLQRCAGSRTGATEYHTTLLGTSQALYKHVGEHTVALPELASDVAERLLAELEWLRQVTWVTIAARGGNWRDPPKGQRVVAALCAPRAKGHAIRSGFCALGFPVEGEMERAFERLIRGLATAGQADGEAITQDWRDNACKILRSHVGRVVEAAKPGSPLRRREAKQCADYVVLEAVKQIHRKGVDS